MTTPQFLALAGVIVVLLAVQGFWVYRTLSTKLDLVLAKLDGLDKRLSLVEADIRPPPGKPGQR